MIRSDCLALVAVALATSCATGRDTFNARRVAAQHEAGSVHFAVLSVAPWDEYVAALQPSFELTADEALVRAIPNTQILQTTAQDVIQSRVGATREEEATDLERPDDPKMSATFNDGFDPKRPMPGVLQQPLGTDPMTLYGAATSLFQEVQLLNRFVRDAAVREGFDPYVVRLQVSLLPAARDQPYDAYVNLGFFSGGEVEGTAPVPVRDPSRPDPDAWRTPQVVPLMVTDNLEGSLQSRVNERIAQTGAALTYLTNNVGAGLDVQAVRRDLDSVLGTDLNSLLTVARLSDNTLRVRLGAQQQAQARWAMVPRAHNVTVLVMVPREAPRSVQVVSRTELVDVERGTVLDARDRGEVRALLEDVAGEHGLDADAATLRELLARAQANDRGGFAAALAELDAADSARDQALWLDLISLGVGSRYASSTFDLPDRIGRDVAALPASQVARLEDDGVESATLKLTGGALVDFARLEAKLFIARGDDRLPLLAQAAGYDPSLDETTFFFASPSAWSLIEPGAPSMELELRLGDATRRFPVAYRR